MKTVFVRTQTVDAHRKMYLRAKFTISKHVRAAGFLYLSMCWYESDIVCQYLPINHVNPLKIYRPYKRCVAYVEYILHTVLALALALTLPHGTNTLAPAHFHSIKWNFHQNFKWPYAQRER